MKSVFGEREMARQRLGLMAGIPLVRATDEALVLTERILRSGILPTHADRDAAHIALATIYEMDILLSWNCRHLANATIQARLRKLADNAGFAFPVICTPNQLMESDHEQNG